MTSLAVRPCRQGMVLAAILFILGCAKAPDLEGIGGAFNVIGPDRKLAVTLGSGELPDHWHTLDKPSGNVLRVTEVQGVPALEVIPTSTEYWYVRELHASLLATPYMSWSWLPVPPTVGAHPVQLVIGFADATTRRKAAWWQLMASDLPVADRTIMIEWSDTALGRGTVVGPKREASGQSFARYIARGGAEFANQWWTDSVDLSLLHRQLWPHKPLKQSEVRYIGIKSHATIQPVSMYLANVRLFR